VSLKWSLQCSFITVATHSAALNVVSLLSASFLFVQVIYVQAHIWTILLVRQNVYIMLHFCNYPIMQNHLLFLTSLTHLIYHGPHRSCLVARLGVTVTTASILLHLAKLCCLQPH
jgi:hypothetical protein